MYIKKKENYLYCTFYQGARFRIASLQKYM